ncbi:protein N-acetyltransferase, RimJ/RimL family [Desulfuromonas soudanensis]|uniref:Protein N-acetyltransferase, RimJ/RimL family n=1 Tax=Desulfuromonas soudanensis TaxID=1603606 RepID=A0A0M5IPC8_9BACT|nr:GNAT family protein [Desulfuromonas soudanensis]ALC18136.1 protein N-acetyltransferase, RimJ/RimL family [Desulfuromonas soudanensis]
MRAKTLWSIEAPGGEGKLLAFEPTEEEVLVAAPLLAIFNNDRHNSAMLTNTQEMTATDIVENYEFLRTNKGRPFLLEQDGVLIGDADFRKFSGSTAEFAILVGSRTEQSRGLGTRYAAMMHLAAFRVLGLERIYASIVPTNVASRRMVEKLGYQLDQSPFASSFAEEKDDIVMSIDRARFELASAGLMSEVTITARVKGLGVGT